MSVRAPTNADDGGAQNQRNRVSGEIGNELAYAPWNFLASAFGSLVSKRTVAKTKSKCGHADRAWPGLKDCDDLDADQLVSRYVDLINGILEASGQGGVGKTRVAVDTRNIRLRHEDGENEWSSPSISIVATGPSFELPRMDGTKGTSPSVGYSNVATVIEVSTEESPYDQDQEDAYHVGRFAREMFIQQPNRLYVRCLLLNQTYARLFHFDRSGVMVNRGFDINRWPDRFISMVLGVCSPQELVLGFDPNIRWKIRKGRKFSGTVNVLDELSGKRKVYDLISLAPIVLKYGITHRGTRCWEARDRETGDTVIIKDTWAWESSEGYLNPEYQALKRAIGIDGVIQMYAFETWEGKPEREIRGFRHQGKRYDDENMVFHRIVIQKYGHPILFSNSVIEIVGALRDAIAAHRTLAVEKHTVHRDLSHSNLLVRPGGVTSGPRGVIIDMDSAVDVSQDGFARLPKVAGTWPTKPVNQLTDVAGMFIHDYLDDLQSLLFVLVNCLIMLPLPKGVKTPKSLAWVLGSKGHAEGMKISFIKSTRTLSQEFEGGVCPWGEPCQTLVESFRDFTRKIYNLKKDMSGPRYGDYAELSKLHRNIHDHYATVLEMFDVCLRRLDVEAQKGQAGDVVEESEGSKENATPRGANVAEERDGGREGRPRRAQKRARRC